MQQRRLGRDSFCRVHCQHSIQQIHASGVELRLKQRIEGTPTPPGEFLVPIWQQRHAGPRRFRRSAELVEDPEQDLYLDQMLGPEQGILGDHLSKHETHRPHVRREAVQPGAEQNLGSPVP